MQRPSVSGRQAPACAAAASAQMLCTMWQPRAPQATARQRCPHSASPLYSRSPLRPHRTRLLSTDASLAARTDSAPQSPLNVRHPARRVGCAAASNASASGGDPQSQDYNPFLRVVAPTALALLLCNMDRICLSVAIIPMSAEFGWPASMQASPIGTHSAYPSYHELCPFAGWYQAPQRDVPAARARVVLCVFLACVHAGRDPISVSLGLHGHAASRRLSGRQVRW